MGKPQDSDIIAELQGVGRDGKPTYYIRNCLLWDGHEITTQQLRTRLKYLEEKGLVKRVKSPFFKNNISWGLV
jgi:repressor of nif and glnA expression